MPMITKLAALALLATLALPARAQTAYVVTAANRGYPRAFSLGTLNMQTGVFHAIATNNRYEGVAVLGFGANGKLYALCYDRSSTPVGMDEYSVDTATGNMTLQKKFANTILVGAGVDRTGVFTGFLVNDRKNGIKLFTLDPVAQSLQIGVPTRLFPTGLVVADGQGHVYATSRQGAEVYKETLAKVINVRTGAVVILGKTNLYNMPSGFLYHGLLYALGEEVPSAPIPGSPPGSTYSINSGIYTLNLTTGAASLVVRFTLPPGSFVMAAALAPAPESSPTAVILSPAAVIAVGLIGLGGLCIRARRKGAGGV